MKKLVILLGLVLICSPFVLLAQEMDDEPVQFNVHLLETFDLVVVDGGVQEITFTVPADYNNGVTQASGGILPGFTTITIAATGDWELSIECPNFTAIAPATGVIPSNQLGVYCEATGNYAFGTQVTCAYQTAPTALGLTNAATLLIGNGSGNAGSDVDNEFILHWLMGTMQGSMNTTSMFDMLTANTFSLGDHTTTAMLNLIKL
jgi:hypothetical protein